MLVAASAAMATFLLLCAILVVAAVRAADESLRVTGLPGFNGTFGSPHYAGYVTIDEQNQRALYYYLVTSERDPSSDPLVLWLNGGPGCSSFDGFIYEQGPFVFKAGTGGSMPRLKRNPYTWAKVASILYLDSPAGVGFSYSNTSSDYATGDIKTALDAHTFLLKWFQLYPEFLSNDFYISGESYAGVYIPNLANNVVNGIEAKLQPAINFKGYMIGNGVTDVEFDGNALVPFAYGMGLISVDLYQEVFSACNGNYWNATDSCSSSLDAVHEEVSDLNIYDILEPCYHDSEAWQSRADIKMPLSFRKLGEVQHEGVSVRKRMFGRAWPLMMQLREDTLVPSWKKLGGDAYVPCLDTQVSTTWLNNPAVREALHAVPESVSGRWMICTDVLSYSWDSGSMIPIHRNLTAKGYRVLIFSGDHDMCVPYTGSEAWTRSLNYEVISSWKPWYAGQQVAGYTVSYGNNLTFATVKGSGHSVPEYKPKEALAMFQRWLAGHHL